MIHTDIARADITPLCVDLDGTLVHCDLLHDGALQAVKASPMAAFGMIRALTRGRMAFKMHVANSVAIDATTLPYRTDLLEHMAQVRAEGRPIHLVTASPRPWAEAVSDHLGLFDEIHASDTVNLKGGEKAALLARLHPQGFDYVGDAKADRPVWRCARNALRAGRGIHLPLDDGQRSIKDFPDSRSVGFSLLKAMRPHQWLKNLLVFVPLLAAHRSLEPAPLFATLLAMIGFSFLASATYLLNDMLDVAADRAHPRKRHRPFAAGEISIPEGLAAFVALATAAGVIAVMLPLGYAWALLLYGALTITYSLYWKRVPLADLFILAALYSMRVVAGGVATGIPLSLWLLGFAMFVFLALAATKRCAEMVDRRKSGASMIPGRGYRRTDLPLIRALGCSSSFAAVIVFSLYVTQPEVRHLYTNPALLWLTAPLILYWLGRMMLLTQRGEMHDDPVVFTMRDVKSLAIIAACGLLMIGASHTAPPADLILAA